MQIKDFVKRFDISNRDCIDKSTLLSHSCNWVVNKRDNRKNLT